MTQKKQTRRHRRIRHRGGDDVCPEGQEMKDNKCTVKLTWMQKLAGLFGLGSKAPEVAPAMAGPAMAGPALAPPAMAPPAMAGAPPEIRTGGNRRKAPRRRRSHKRK